MGTCIVHMRKTPNGAPKCNESSEPEPSPAKEFIRFSRLFREKQLARAKTLVWFRVCTPGLALVSDLLSHQGLSCGLSLCEEILHGPSSRAGPAKHLSIASRVLCCSKVFSSTLAKAFWIRQKSPLLSPNSKPKSPETLRMVFMNHADRQLSPEMIPASQACWLPVPEVGLARLWASS